MGWIKKEKDEDELIRTIAGIILVIILIALAMTFPLFWLWNWLMPDIFGLPQITVWQALGLNLMCMGLFKTSK